MPDPVPPPFRIVLHRAESKPDGSFRPASRVEVTPYLRTSGLLAQLSGEDLKSLLLLLTFAHPNGHVQPSLAELSEALGQSWIRTAGRMRRLERFLWHGRPAAYRLHRESGLHAYAPSPRILGTEIEPEGVGSSTAPALAPAGKEAAIAHSRAAYARPRAEVEAEIARLNGWDVKEAVELPEVRALRLLGVPGWQAEELLERCGPERVRQQVEWLPYRSARDPARLLVAAIQGDYAPPAGMSTPTNEETNRQLPAASDGT